MHLLDTADVVHESDDDRRAHNVVLSGEYMRVIDYILSQA